MGPLDLALIGPTIFGGVGDSIESGAKASDDSALARMRTKEVVAGTAIVGIGAMLALREKALWPILISIGVVALMVCLHEYHARQIPTRPDLVLVIGGFK